MMQIRDFVKSNTNLHPDEIISELDVQIKRLRAMADAILKNKLALSIAERWWVQLPPLPSIMSGQFRTAHEKLKSYS